MLEARTKRQSVVVGHFGHFGRFGRFGHFSRFSRFGCFGCFIKAQVEMSKC